MTREEAIQDFLASNEIGLKARQTLEAVLQQNPRAILFVWETGAGLGLTSVPFSKALTNGLVQAAAELMFEGEVTEAADPDEDFDEC